MPRQFGNCVLLVDDDPSVRNLLARHFEKAGIEAYHAEDGIDALGKLRDKLPKVIVTDLQMPRMAGWEFIRVVRRRFPTIPIVALSGSIPIEFPAELRPDRWFEKRIDQYPQLVQAVNGLARETTEDVSPPQVVSSPARIRTGFAGYSMLTGTDCLRTFRAATPREFKSTQGTAVCTHCAARVPFLVETSATE